MNDVPNLFAPPANIRRGWQTSVTNDETRIRYFAQSILTYFFHQPETPSVVEARDIIRWATPAT